MGSKRVKMSEYDAMTFEDVAEIVKNFDSLQVLEGEEERGDVGYYEIFETEDGTPEEPLYTAEFHTWNNRSSLTGEESCTLQEAIDTVEVTIQETLESQ